MSQSSQARNAQIDHASTDIKSGFLHSSKLKTKFSSLCWLVYQWPIYLSCCEIY